MGKTKVKLRSIQHRRPLSMTVNTYFNRSLIKVDNMVWTILDRLLPILHHSVWDTKKENFGTKTDFLMTFWGCKLLPSPLDSRIFGRLGYVPQLGEKMFTERQMRIFKNQVIELYFLFSFSDGKIYDAYVIYPRNQKNSPEGASSVEHFVHQILPDVLENKCGYNLCIYGRDLRPGEGKAINIHQGQKVTFIWRLRDRWSYPCIG